MVKLIDGKILAEIIKDEVVREIIKLNARPNLAIILVGDREDSKLYVSLKEKEAKKCGIDTHLYKCASNISEREIFEMIECLNNDDFIDAILVQLPLPDGFDTDGIVMAIDPKKDADRFHPDNLRTLFRTCDHEEVIPPVHGAVLKILEGINCDPKEKKVCLIANSDIFGKSLAKVLECKQAEVHLAKADEKGLAEKTEKADILITAVGRPKFIKKEMIKEGAVIIDIGISRENGKTVGDVDLEDVKEKAGFLTPVPGGIGPMTIAMLFKNTLELHKKRRK